MKDLREMFDALEAGEILIDEQYGCEIKIQDGLLIGLVSYNKLSPEHWEIKQEPKWYENINGRKVLCKVWNSLLKDDIIVISVIDYKNGYTFPFRTDTITSWKNAIPLTPSEIQEYLDNALDIEDNDF